jgi:hypothetical protein
LANNKEYLANHPELGEYLKAHPAVTQAVGESAGGHELELGNAKQQHGWENHPTEGETESVAKRWRRIRGWATGLKILSCCAG